MYSVVYTCVQLIHGGGEALTRSDSMSCAEGSNKRSISGNSRMGVVESLNGPSAAPANAHRASALMGRKQKEFLVGDDRALARVPRVRSDRCEGGGSAVRASSFGWWASG